jgi:transposase
MGTAAELLEKATREELVQAFLMAVDQNKVYAEQSKVQAGQIEAQAEQIETQAEQIEKLQFQLAKLQKMFFGSRSEKSRTLYPDHPTLFDVPALEDEQEVETEEVVIQRQKVVASKSKPVRKELPRHLPRRKQVIEPENLPAEAERIGEKVTEVLEYTPPKLWVRRIVRPTYRLVDGTITTAEMPDRWMDRSQAGESVVAQTITAKFCDHLPTYRQVQMFAREGYKLSESTLNQWIMEAGHRLTPLFLAMKTAVLSQFYLQADETTIRVLPEKGKNKQNMKSGSHLGYFWVYRSPVLNLPIFTYQPGRGQECPIDVLRHFSGVLQTDGYAAYDAVAKESEGRIELAGCWAHARRKFVEAEKSDPKAVAAILRGIGLLYTIEKYIRQAKASPEEVLRLRGRARSLLQKARPNLEALMLDLRPNKPLRKAINYTLKRWDKLLLYTERPGLEIDNNAIENSIRPVAVGRKNYLFAGSHESAQMIAQIYSFVAACKTHDINPSEWLADVLVRLPATKPSQYSELFPSNWSRTLDRDEGLSKEFFLDEKVDQPAVDAG